MTTIDYERLNEAAQMLHDAAYAKGERAGREASGTEVVEDTGRGMLLVAGQVLMLAVQLPTPELRVEAAVIAARTYDRTPGGPSFDGGRIAGKFDRALKRGISHRPGNDIDIEAAGDLARTLIAIGNGGAS